jgi:molybdate transport system substrate-binding protein
MKGATEMSRKLIVFLFILLPISSAWAQTVVRVAAAADLEPVLPPIIEQFQKDTGIRVQPTFSSSGILTTQVLNGAPFDMFFAADFSYPKKLIDAGVADRNREERDIHRVAFAG